MIHSYCYITVSTRSNKRSIGNSGRSSNRTNLIYWKRASVEPEIEVYLKLRWGERKKMCLRSECRGRTSTVKAVQTNRSGQRSTERWVKLSKMQCAVYGSHAMTFTNAPPGATSNRKFQAIRRPPTHTHTQAEQAWNIRNINFFKCLNFFFSFNLSRIQDEMAEASLGGRHRKVQSGSRNITTQSFQTAISSKALFQEEENNRRLRR